MAALFDSYPEVLFDAKYRLNDRRMPLFLMLVIDCAGETEVACIMYMVWLIRSENKLAVESMLDSFKTHNEN